MKFNNADLFQYQPFKKGGQGTLAERAKKLGLGDAAQRILGGERCFLKQLIDSKTDGTYCF